jgi:hypothetical protein
MVERSHSTFIDDLDGGPAECRIGFGFDGEQYTIDLSQRNAERLRAAFRPYIVAAQKAPLKASSARAWDRRQVSRKLEEIIREWAAGVGYMLGAADSIPLSTVEIFYWTHEYLAHQRCAPPSESN